MKKYILANILRKRQVKLGEAPKYMISALSDDRIIDSYITCSCCGEKEVTEEELEVSIANATDYDSWCDLLEAIKGAKQGHNDDNEQAED